jgi:drug/metabolite transporter (DMT)-like permease
MNLRTFNQNQHRLGILFAFGALISAGTYNALAKGLTPFLSPVSLLILSEALTAFFIVVTFGLVPLLKKLGRLDAKSIRIAAIIGLLNSAVAPMCWFTGLSRTSAASATMLSSADIVCILILGHFLLKETITRMQVLGAGAVVLGIFTINVAAMGEGLSVHIGDLFIVFGSIVSGCGAVLFKKYLSHIMPELAILIRCVTGIVAVSLVTVFVEQSVPAEVAAFPISKIMLLLAFTFFSRYLDLTFFYEALDRLPATTFSLIQIGAPVSGLFFAYMLLGEQIHSYQVLGAVFIVLGLMLEQISAQSINAIQSRWHMLRHPLQPRKNTPEIIGMLPKNV